MVVLHTKQRVLELLKEAAEKQMTTDEARQQKISYVMGSLDEKSPITKELVEGVLNRQAC